MHKNLLPCVQKSHIDVQILHLHVQIHDHLKSQLCDEPFSASFLVFQVLQ